MIQHAWSQITADMDEAAKAKLSKLDAVVIREKHTSDVVPGVTTFTWGGARGIWRLEFGDFTAQVRVMRPNDGAQPDDDAQPAEAKQPAEATPLVFLPNA